MITKLILSGASVLAIAAVANAHPHHATTEMSCADAAGLVTEHGAIVLHTGEYTYDRYVSHGGYCDYYQTTRPAYVPTQDGQCFVGYTCEDKDGDGGNGG